MRIICIVAYLLLNLAIGYGASRRVQNTPDFVLASQRRPRALGMVGQVVL